MSDILFIRLLEGQRAQWALATKQGNLVGQPIESALDEVPKPQDARCSIVVLLPTEQVSLHEVKLPGHNRKQQLQAIPFALENDLLESVEKYCFAMASKRNANKRFSVAVVRREYFQHCLDELRAVDLQAHVILPDVLALDYQQGISTVYIENHLALVRTGAMTGFAVDVENLEWLLKEHESSQKIQVICQGAEDVKLNLPVEMSSSSSLLEQAAHHVSHKPDLNMLQGEFRHKKVKGSIRWYASRKTAIVLFIVLLLACLMGKIVRYASLHYVASTQHHLLTKLYQKNFPKTALPVDPKASMAARLQALREASAGDPVLQAVTKLGKVLQQYPNLALQALQYSHKELTVVLPLVNLQWQHKLVSALQKEGLRLDYAYKNNVLTLKIKDVG